VVVTLKNRRVVKTSNGTLSGEQIQNYLMLKMIFEFAFWSTKVGFWDVLWSPFF